MLRSMIARTATTGLLTGLLVVASPTASEAAPDHKPWGSVTMKNYVLKAGCHRYAYRYEITVPHDEGWTAEIFFISPDGTGLASNTIDSNSQKDQGKRRITVCRPSTSYGKHKIRMKVSYSDGDDVTVGRVKPTSFRFLSHR